MAQSAEQYRLNTYMYIEIMNVVKKKRKYALINTAEQNCTGIDNYLSIYIYIYIHIYIHTHTHTHIYNIYLS